MHFLNGNHHDRFVMVQALTSVYEKSGRLCFGLSAIGLSSDFHRTFSEVTAADASDTIEAPIANRQIIA